MRKDYLQYLAGIDLAKRILEIGPLAAPILTKAEAQVFYADIRNTEEVREFYKNDPKVDAGRICPIDYVIKGSYNDSLRNVEPFDYVISSHVLEHMPRLIEHFLDIANVVSDKGCLYIFIPDHRYCFDHFRTPTSFAEAYAIHSQGIANNPMRVLDFSLEESVIANASVYWQGGVPFGRNQVCKMNEALTKFERAMQGEYIDVHFSVFSPNSFLILIYHLIQAKLFPFLCVDFFPTPGDTCTFGIVLQKCPEMGHETDITKNEKEKILSWINSSGAAQKDRQFSLLDKAVYKLLLKLLPTSSALRKRIRRWQI